MTNFSTDGTVIQYDTIQVSGTYALTAEGAQGGAGANGTAGGLGAAVSGDIYLTSGTVLEIIVGVTGETTNFGGGGGGGGSFVFETFSGSSIDPSHPVIVAGGGGGAGFDHAGGGGQSGSTGGGGTPNGGAGGEAGAPGAGGGDTGGGGGYTGGAGSFNLIFGSADAGTISGTSFLGGAGGRDSGVASAGDGGFGGGGGAGGSAGGGGGGYGGGGGGRRAGGGGGGSYDKDLTNVAATGSIHSGEGEVSITLLPTTFTATGQIQYDTITTSGTYALTADGAQGGDVVNSGGATLSGGLGAVVTGDIYLAAGTVLEIVVGTQGGSNGSYSAGGGGGSFVFETFSGSSIDPFDPVIVAGGGGGAGNGGQGGGGQTGPTGGNGFGTDAGGGGKSGQPGHGGFFGGGGGGYTGGRGASIPAGGGLSNADGGSDAGNSFGGGAAGYTAGGGVGAGSGGFGGGGGGGVVGAGGGGGFGGGGGGSGLTKSGGGGGGSYDKDLTNAMATGTIHSGDGLVTLEFVAAGICYLRGTRILTPTGEVRIEELRIGDRVITRFGGTRRIQWIGRQVFEADNAAEYPVHIRPHALGENQPARDLFVSAGHSMLIENRLILAKLLVNGVTITQGPVPGAWIEYFNLDLGVHDCIIAEGTWSESYADAHGLRARFHNAASFLSRYPDVPPAEELALCAERPEHGPRLNEALRPVVARAAAGITPGPLQGYLERLETPWMIIGWAHDPAHPQLPVLLEVCAGDAVLGTVLACDARDDLAAAGKGTGRCAFTFTSPVRITPELRASLRIRRAADHAPLPVMPEIQPAPAAQTPQTAAPKLRLVG